MYWMTISWPWLKVPAVASISKKKFCLHDKVRTTYADLISSELHRQLKPFKDALEAKDREIKELKKTISDQNDKLDQLEQHGRRDSLRIAGIPENEASDDTDAAVLTLCAVIKVDPPVQAQDIAISHRACKAATG